MDKRLATAPPSDATATSVASRAARLPRKSPRAAETIDISCMQQGDVTINGRRMRVGSIETTAAHRDRALATEGCRQMSSNDPRCVVIPLPGGRIARVPLAVLEAHVDPNATPSHAADGSEPDSEAVVTAPSDVTAHHLKTDATSGTSNWHTDYEYGMCSYTDEAGFPQYGQAWHCHPLGSEYAEVMR